MEKSIETIINLKIELWYVLCQKVLLPEYTKMSIRISCDHEYFLKFFG